MSDIAAAEVAEETTEPVTEEVAAVEATPNGEDTTVVDIDNWRSPITDKAARKVADRFTTLDDMAKGIVDLQKRDGQIRVPGKKSSDEDRAAYNKAIGVPETAEGYEFASPEGHEPTEADKAFQASAAEIFHKFDVPADTAKGLNEWYNEMGAALAAEQVKEDKAYAKATEKALKAEWPGEEYPRNKEYADRAAVKIFGGDLEDVKMIEDKTGRYVLDHPAFVKALASVGREMSEGRLGGVMSESEQGAAQTKISDLEKRIETAQNDGDDGLANKLYQEQQDLYRTLHGSALVVGSEGRSA